MHRLFAAITRWVNESLASPWALAVALALIAFYLVVGPRLGVPEQRFDLAFGVDRIAHAVLAFFERR